MANLRSQFLLGLRDLGYVEGPHFQLEQRSADGRSDRLPGLARELARLPVDMFVVGGEAATAPPCKQPTQSRLL